MYVSVNVKYFNYLSNEKPTRFYLGFKKKKALIMINAELFLEHENSFLKEIIKT